MLKCGRSISSNVDINLSVAQEMELFLNIVCVHAVIAQKC